MAWGDIDRGDFVWGEFGSGGFCPRGILSGGILSGGGGVCLGDFVWGDFVLSPLRIRETMHSYTLAVCYMCASPLLSATVFRVLM